MDPYGINVGASCSHWRDPLPSDYSNVPEETPMTQDDQSQPTKYSNNEGMKINDQVIDDYEDEYDIYTKLSYIEKIRIWKKKRGNFFKQCHKIVICKKDSVPSCHVLEQHRIAEWKHVFSRKYKAGLSINQVTSNRCAKKRPLLKQPVCKPETKLPDIFLPRIKPKKVKQDKVHDSDDDDDCGQTVTFEPPCKKFRESQQNSVLDTLTFYLGQLETLTDSSQPSNEEKSQKNDEIVYMQKTSTMAREPKKIVEKSMRSSKLFQKHKIYQWKKKLTNKNWKPDAIKNGIPDGLLSFYAAFREPINLNECKPIF